MEASGQRIHAWVQVRGVAREVEAGGCQEAIDALALITAMILDTVPPTRTASALVNEAPVDSPALPAEPISLPQARQTKGWHSTTWVSMGAGGGAMGGVPAWELSAGVHHAGQGPLALVMGADFTTRGMSFTREAYDVRLQWLSLRFTAGATFSVLRPTLAVDIGGFAEMGVNWSPEVRGPLDAAASAGWAASVGPMLRVRMMLLPGHAVSPLLAFEATNLVALTRHRFFVEEGPELLSLRSVNPLVRVLFGCRFE